MANSITVRNLERRINELNSHVRQYGYTYLVRWNGFHYVLELLTEAQRNANLGGHDITCGTKRDIYEFTGAMLHAINAPKIYGKRT